MKSFDVAIIGAGPAGMASAIEATRNGLSVIVLDEQPAPGGQIYRAIETVSDQRAAILGTDYLAGRDLAAAFRNCGATYVSGATVWNIDNGLKINYSRAGLGSDQISATSLVIATGAIERPTPMPGWTLPGVTTAGALQILLKAHGAVNDDVVLVGSGPLLYLVATQMLTARYAPRAIVETTPAGRLIKAARHLPRALTAFSYLRKGLAMKRKLHKSGIPFYANARAVAIEGTTTAQAVIFQSGGKSHRIETTAVALHQGVIPNQQITRLLRCEHDWNANQHCFVPRLDAFFQTTVENIYVAGDGAGIGGAVSAALRGRLVALRIAEKQGKDTIARQNDVLKKLKADQAIRPFLETLYAPSPENLLPADDVMVCRCEEITAGQIRHAVDLGAPGPNQVKSYLRCGMGPCQGRMCGPTVTQIIADHRKKEVGEIDYYRIRPPLKPLALAELAAIESEPTRHTPL
ncbi:NAD(P)/FAD-dependent oxidoreductase [Thalassospira sp.]|uniref:NAD(P)/FAD-dependent oxidoreductase n=1 Tax=Thalassospira sp. TaxID=1912094 RepID=UPI00273257D9|nr:NAD(P)/FAD-dependent oxidoreductase [Thalassospira sp.]MDP2699774.1 NAD(P)/FAD-dependent oxidoreductase [Thalassospira sp.]